VHNPTAALNNTNVGYGYNYYWLGMSWDGIAQSMNSLAAIRYPSETLMLGETGKNTTGYVIEAWAGIYRPQDIHFDGANFTFADGHVKWLKTAQVNAGYGTPNSLWGDRP
jgi:prepilin-type processing-associated H-X9-DG protein